MLIGGFREDSFNPATEKEESCGMRRSKDYMHYFTRGESGIEDIEQTNGGEGK